MNDIIFYNHFHNGDITLSRIFLKDIIKKTKMNSYKYVHENSSRILLDIPEIEHIKDKPDNLNISADPIWFVRDDTMYINTWFNNRQRHFYNNHGPCLKNLYDNFKEIYEYLNIPIEDLLFYLPDYDYNYFTIHHIDEFIDNNKGKNIIMVCNSVPRSAQSHMNLQLWEDVIRDLMKNDINDVIIFTTPISFSNEKLFYSHDIIKCDSFENLPEHSYLSEFVNEIYHCDSAPGSFTFNKVNYFRKVPMQIYSTCRNFYPSENELNNL